MAACWGGGLVPAANAAPIPVSNVVASPADETRDADVQALQYLVEEEKLAHDVYTVLASVPGDRIFSNIAKAEIRHMQTIQDQLKRLGATDPSGTAVGEFSNPEFTALYQDYVAKGSQSRQAALQVGVEIEQLDIKDLTERMAAISDPEVRDAFTYLLRGSRNHEKAFTRKLSSFSDTSVRQSRGDGQGNGQGQRQGQGRGDGQGDGRSDGQGRGASGDGKQDRNCSVWG